MVTALAELKSVAGSLPQISELSRMPLNSSGWSSLTGSAPFGDLFADAISRVNQLEDQARVAVDGLMTGKGVDVHQAMIASEKASMAFELALAVRNKAVQSYQSVMSMQF